MSGTALGLLVDSSVRVVLVATLVAVALAVLRVQAGASRHTAWTVVLIAMLLMPVLSRAVPPVAVPVPAAVSGLVAKQMTATRMAPAGTKRSGGVPHQPSRLARPAAGPDVSAGPAPENASGPGWSWSGAALAIYVTGVALMLLRFALGLLGSRRLARSGRPVDASTDRRLGSVSARVRESGLTTVPVTVGFFRPIVILPPDWRRWSDSQLRAVLAHEQAHVTRRDSLVTGLACLNLCLFWFHPLAWWLRRTLALTAEQASDESALRTVNAPQTYIDVLRKMAAAVRARGGRYLWQGVGMNGSPLLARRIAHIQRVSDRPAASSMTRALIVAAGCLITVACAACRLGGDAPEDPPQDYERLMASGRWPVEHLIDEFPDTEVAVPQADRPRAEEILLERRAEDPAGPWSARLGRFYASSMVGHRVQVTEGGPLTEVTGFDPESAFSEHARAQLDESNDPVLLAAAARYLRDAPHYAGGFTDREVLAKGYLERAVRLDPEAVRARAMLASVVSRERGFLALQRDRAQGPVYHFETLAALPAAERFEAMAAAAVDSQWSARSARQKTTGTWRGTST